MIRAVNRSFFRSSGSFQALTSDCHISVSPYTITSAVPPAAWILAKAEALKPCALMVSG